MNHQVAKRYACDRCREQKLRCDRSQPTDKSCERCTRMGAQCTMSTGRPLGRPSAQKSQEAHILSSRQIRRRDFTQSRDNPRRTAVSSLSGEAYGPAPASAPANNGPSISSRSSLSHADAAAATTQQQQQSQSPKISSHFLVADDPAAFNAMCELLDESRATGAGSPPPMNAGTRDYGMNEQQFHIFGSAAGDMEIELTDGDNLGQSAENESNACPTPWTDDQMDNESACGGGDSSGVRRHSTASFADILANIIYQLAELRDLLGDGCDPQLGQRSQGSGSGSDHAVILPSADGSSSGSASWDRAVSVTMRFAMVLEAVAPPHMATTTSSSPPVPYAPPTRSDMLLLLSAYVQLGEVFDMVFRRITQHLQEPHHHHHQKRASLSLLPHAWTGFPAIVPRSSSSTLREGLDLHVLMMAQFVEKQLHGMEDSLGIPADCRLWSAKDTSYAGIMDRDDLTGLARDVIRHTQEPFRSLKHGISCVRMCFTCMPYK
ncbi:hypothetical protein F5Y14DRAFT_52228 [Nemania sp. NC0429]|nr:hypothetical protein F5Y14DRAFT_52228 [Nemania sp. NC0429]